MVALMDSVRLLHVPLGLLTGQVLVGALILG